MAQAEVIVVGAGIVGCAVAHALATAGHRVRVLDGRAPGRGATQASAGVLAPAIEGHDSEAFARLARRSLDLYDDFVAALDDVTPPGFAYERNGTLEAALDTVAVTRLRTTAEGLARIGVEARWLDAAALAALEPACVLGTRGGLLIPSHGFVSAGPLVTALQAAAQAAGGTFHDGVRVRRIDPAASGRVAVHTATETIDADHVVLALGSWSGQIELGEAEPLPIRPVRGQLLHLTLPVRRFTRVIWGPECYMVPWPDGSVLVGATVEEVGFDERATVTGVTGLLEAACAFCPELATATFSGVRVGLRPAGPDHLPVVGRSTAIPGLIYATAHFRNGVLLAPLTASLVRDLVAGRDDDPALALLAPGRFGEHFI